MSKFYNELSGYKSFTIAEEIGVHFTTVYKLVRKNDPRIKKAIKALKAKKVLPEMTEGKDKLQGFSPKEIKEETGLCRATIYNYANGKTSTETALKIEAAIIKLKNQNHDHDPHDKK